jgi:catechol 2,3-dioxygenase-like lactoylglutathione lyase family enzyme
VPRSGITLGVVAIDCNDLDEMVSFWTELLGVRVTSREPDWVNLEPAMAGGPCLAFQLVPEPKAGKNRLHLDVWVDDLEAEIARAEGLGARRMGGVVQESDNRFQVLTDPAGNEFCLVAAPL